MSDIEWTDVTLNPIRARRRDGQPNKADGGWACQRVSPGCQHCYAETINHRLGTGLDYDAKGLGESEVYLDERALMLPLRWKKPRKIFLGSMTDVFGEWVPFEWLDRLFAVMALTPQHVYQVLTKRPERMREYLATNRAPMDVDREAFRMVDKMHLRFEDAVLGDFRWPGWPLPNVWLGVSAENQWWADVRIPELLATPAAVRFLSCEPLLGPLGFAPLKSRKLAGGGHEYTHYLTGTRYQWDPSTGEDTRLGPGIDWVIVGGESGPGARPFDVAWARSLVSQCRAAGVAVFVKQLGAKPVDRHATCAENHPPEECWPDTRFEQGQWAKLKSRKGGEPDEWPEDLRVREWPV